MPFNKLRWIASCISWVEVQRAYQTIDKLWHASGGSLGFDSCPSWSKDFRFATANSRSLRGWIVDITRQCTASSDATMVSGHETWLTGSSGQRIRENCVQGPSGVLWCGMEVQEDSRWNDNLNNVFFCCLDDRLYPHPLFLGVAVLNKSFLCLGISGIQVKFIGDII